MRNQREQMVAVGCGFENHLALSVMVLSEFKN